jgi:predicted Zn-dependent protease
MLIRRTTALTVLLLCLSGNLWADTDKDIQLPEMGDSAGTIISPEEERRWGESIMRGIRQSVFFVDDPEVNEYFQSLGYTLASNSDNAYQRFTFFVIKSPDINAFATPGGFIGVNSGLILGTRSESELASVVAHEIAHVTQRHMARAYEAYSKLTLPMVAGTIAAVLIGTQNPKAGSAALMATQGMGAQIMIDFTRSNEQEADRLGITTLARSGFDPRAMPSFFERMQQLNRYQGDSMPEFLRTHPVTLNRIADSRNRAERYAAKQFRDSLDYHLVRAKMRVLQSEDPAELAEYFKQALSGGQYENRDAMEFGYALSLLYKRQFSQAREYVNRLVRGDRERIEYLILQARLETAEGNLATADRLYKQALHLYPKNYPLTFHYARMLLQYGKAEEARTLLEDFLRYRSDAQPEMYRMLATAEGDSGHPAAAHAAMAEYYFHNGQAQQAIAQIQLARKFKITDEYLAAQMEGRMKEYKREAELMKDMQIKE